MTGAEASQAALSIKPAVKEFAELWKEFPDGGSFGWFAFVNEAKTFAYWDIDIEDWVLFSRESNMNSTYVSLLIDAFVESTPTISDYLIGSGKKRFTVQSIVDLFKIPTSFTEAFQTLSQNVDGLSSTVSDKQDAIQNNITLLFVGDCSQSFPNVSSNGELVFDTSTQRLYSSLNIGGQWQWIDIDIRQDTVYVCKKSYYLGNQQSSTLIKLSDGDVSTELKALEDIISFLNYTIDTETSIRTNAVSALYTYINNLKNDLLGGASSAFDSFKELQTLLENDAQLTSTLVTGIANKSSKIYLSAISETPPTGMPPAADLLALCTSTGQLYKAAELSYAPGAYAWEEIQADPATIYYHGDTSYFVSGGLLKKVGESALAVVNNLTAGGITAPLSAEMGKTLNDMLAFLSYTVDVETNERTNADVYLASSIQTVSNGLADKIDKVQLSAISETAPTGMPPAEDLLALCTSTGQLYKSAELSYAQGAYAWEETQADPQSIYYYVDTTYFVSGGLLKKGGVYQNAVGIVSTAVQTLTEGEKAQVRKNIGVLESFIRPSKNFYNENNKISGYVMNSSNGSIYSTGVNSVVTEYINALKDEQFIVSGIPLTNFGSQNNYWYSFYDSNKNPLYTAVQKYGLPTSKAPTGTLYVVFQIAYAGTTTTTSGVQIEKQTYVTDYASFALNNYYEAAGSNQLNKILTNFIPNTENIFTKQGCINQTQGTNSPFDLYVGNSTRLTSGYIPVTNNVYYVLRVKKTNYQSGAMPWIGCYNSSYSVLGVLTDGNSMFTRIYPVGYDDYYVYRFTVINGSSFILIQSVFNGSTQDLDSIQLEIGKNPTSYVSYSSIKNIVSVNEVLQIPYSQNSTTNYINLFDKNEAYFAILSTANPGTESSTNNSKISNYIEVKDGNWYSFKFKTSNYPFNWGGWANLYNSSKVYVSQYLNGGYYIQVGLYTICYIYIPTGISYIKLQISYTNDSTADYDTVSFIKGVGNYDYLPFGNYLTSIDNKYIRQIDNDIALVNTQYYKKKFVFLGDSISYQNLWQKLIQPILGFVYNINELTTGVNSYDATAVGGSMITPFITNSIGQTAGKSIYYRADSVKYYSPDYIFLFGGQNDNITTMGGQIPIGSISDAEYTGNEVTSNPPSFYSSYKGVLKKLITQNPSATIICLTPLQSVDQSYNIKRSKTDAIINCAKMYSCKIINLCDESGINSITFSNDLQDGVHPNSNGAEKIKRCIGSLL